jgi:hypothetical protein
MLVDYLGVSAIGYRESLNEGQAGVATFGRSSSCSTRWPSSAPRRTPGLGIPLAAGRRSWFPSKERA